MPNKVTYSNKNRQNLGADVNIVSPTPFQTIIDAYNNPIDLEAQTISGWVLEIHNNSGGQIQIDFPIGLAGASNNELLMNNGTHGVFIYLNEEDISEKYRMIGGSISGLTLQ